MRNIACRIGASLRHGKPRGRNQKNEKIKNKKGLLRIIVAETLTNEVYYFKVPYDAYKDMTAFYIYFNEDGTPKYNGKSWQYQCKNFTEMSL